MLGTDVKNTILIQWLLLLLFSLQSTRLFSPHDASLALVPRALLPLMGVAESAMCEFDCMDPHQLTECSVRGTEGLLALAGSIQTLMTEFYPRF